MICVVIGMSQYAQACRENIKSGRMLLECSSADLEKSLGITNPMHKRKLRLALDDHKGPNVWCARVCVCVCVSGGSRLGIQGGPLTTSSPLFSLL